MKKQITTLFLVAAAMLMPLSLTSCGEDVATGNDGTETGTGTGTGSKTGTKFSSRPAGTRTSLSSTADANNKFPFYWETNDNIFVDEKKDGTFTLPSSRTEIDASDKNLADFFFNNANLTEKTYDLVYTGNASTKTDEVTIKNVQEQNGWNSSAHLGTSGDCGVATATQDAIGDYSFELIHKASYLILTPFLNSVIDESCRLTRIEIVADNTIAGTYQFSASGLNTGSVTSSSNTITLNCTGMLPITATSTDACFVVLQPGSHTLTIKYTITSQTQNREFTFVKDAFTKTFSEGGVTTVRHELIPLTFTGGYHKWGANRPWPASVESVAGGLVTPPTQLTQGAWGTIPNANEMFWYIKNGDPRWDGQTPWIFTNTRYYTGSAWVYQKNYLATGGVWMKKKAVIQANANGTMTRCGGSSHGGNGPTFCDVHGVNNRDMRAAVLFHPDTYGDLCSDNSSHYQTAGRPADVTDYFFLPAIGLYDWKGGGFFTQWQTESIYWSKSPAYALGTNDASVTETDLNAWRFSGKPTSVAIWMLGKGYGCVLGTTDWFK